MMCSQAVRTIVAGVALLVVLGGSALAAEARRPARPRSKLEFLQPSVDGPLRGTVEVRVNVVPVVQGRLPSYLCTGVGGAPWTPMQRVEGTNQWTARVDSTAAPNGRSEVIVFGKVPDEGRISEAIEVAVDNPLNCYFADLPNFLSHDLNS